MRGILAAFCVGLSLWSQGVSGQAMPNFSGTWVPDTEKNPAGVTDGVAGGRGRGASPTPVTITMTAATIQIERVVPSGKPAPQVFKLDGSESKNLVNGRGTQIEQIAKARIEGQKVIIVTTGPGGDASASWFMEGSWLVNERSAGGTVMKQYYKKG